MKIMIHTFILCALLFTTACKKDNPQPNTTTQQNVDSTGLGITSGSKLIINLSGMKNSNGVINLAVYNTQSGFDNSNNQYKTLTVSAQASSQTLTVTNLPTGDYAFGIYHDENNNSQLDDNFLGIPTEGFAFSNGAMGNFGPPSWSQAKFTVGQNQTVTQSITLNFY